MRRDLGLFAFGGGAYVALELLYRARSHWTMFLLGGGCFLAIGQLGRHRPRLPLHRQAVLGSCICTGGELVTGLAFNRDFSVWDYRGQPGNFLGQICPMFMALWVPFRAAGLALYGWTERGLDRLWKNR